MRIKVLAAISVVGVIIWIGHEMSSRGPSVVELLSDGQICTDGRNVPFGEFERFVPEAPIIFEKKEYYEAVFR